MFLLETAPSLTEVKGSMQFGMLCNLEFAGKNGLQKKKRVLKWKKLVKQERKSFCMCLNWWLRQQFLGFATIRGYSPNFAGNTETYNGKPDQCVFGNEETAVILEGGEAQRTHSHKSVALKRWFFKSLLINHPVPVNSDLVPHGLGTAAQSLYASLSSFIG